MKNLTNSVRLHRSLADNLVRVNESKQTLLKRTRSATNRRGEYIYSNEIYLTEVQAGTRYSYLHILLLIVQTCNRILP